MFSAPELWWPDHLTPFKVERSDIEEQFIVLVSFVACLVMVTVAAFLQAPLQISTLTRPSTFSWEFPRVNILKVSCCLEHNLSLPSAILSGAYHVLIATWWRGGTNQPAREMTAMAEMAGHMRQKDVEIVGEVGGSRPWHHPSRHLPMIPAFGCKIGIGFLFERR